MSKRLPNQGLWSYVPSRLAGISGLAEGKMSRAHVGVVSEAVMTEADGDGWRVLYGAVYRLARGAGLAHGRSERIASRAVVSAIKDMCASDVFSRERRVR